ncbi:glucokinase regulatory protein [Echeneis naucrates]|uniref:glucokinase regulatory protein n=1 Tax=Echeneis naucrates TaxID=173247 RepID=UPI0011138E47|nr:glucokinase regulatory protein [Echeneis naucrates]
MFPFPLLPSCEMHDNRTVMLARGARIPRHFPDTCCPLPSRAEATAVALSRTGREEPSEPAAARRRLPFFRARSSHRHRHRHRELRSSSSSGIRSRPSPAALHHPVLRVRSSRATGGYDVMHLTLFLRRSPDHEPTLPVSEKSNPLTHNIDQASAACIVRMLQACDAQMFQAETGETYQVPRLQSDAVVKTVMEVAKRVELILKDPLDKLVVLSGCGTSGRLAFLMASSFNRELKKLNQSLVYSYIIAGGDKALFSSQEAPEDDPKLGMLSLKKVSEGKKQVLFIGISCGLSAPFVAGQLDFCLQHPEVYTPVMVGFNPTHQAKDEPVPGCTFTFRSLVHKMQELAKSQKAFLINPTVGPEAISGSSRMKGGSATKILLDIVLSTAHSATFNRTPITYKSILQHMKAYDQTVDITYAQSEAITALVEAAGQSLRHGRRVCYLGWGSLAVLGLIDASECNPTFGADYEDVRGFMCGGYRNLNNNEGPLTSLGPQFSIGHEDFLHLVLPHVSDQDTVLLLYTHSDNVSEVLKLACQVREKTSNLHAVYHGTDGDTTAEQWELSTKLVLNAISTGAHILKGKVYQNHMIDVQVTNSKLYCRATRLLQKLSGQPESKCEEALLKAIYRVDKLTTDVMSFDMTTHTLAARNRTKTRNLIWRNSQS